MKRKMMFVFLTVIMITSVVSRDTFGQTLKPNTAFDWQKKVNKIFTKEKSRFLFKDSIAIYTYNFKLKIVRSKEDTTKVINILASDTLLYELYPNYKDLYTINYSPLLGTRNEVNLVIPILVYSISPTGASKYQKQDGESVVSIESALEINQKILFSLLPKSGFEEVVLFKPVIIKILNINDKEPVLLKQ